LDFPFGQQVGGEISGAVADDSGLGWRRQG
jgi:hypothetical protein